MNFVDPEVKLDTAKAQADSASGAFGSVPGTDGL